MNKYGLRNKKTDKLLGVTAHSNDGQDFCGDTEYILDEYDNDTTWLIDSAGHAQWVLEHPTAWYNAGYDTPNHSLKPSEFEVVEVEMKLTPVEVKLPTYKEVAKWKAKGDKKDYDFYMYQHEERDSHFSLYDIREYLRANTQ